MVWSETRSPWQSWFCQAKVDQRDGVLEGAIEASSRCSGHASPFISQMQTWGPRDLESRLAQIGERPRGRPLASCKCPYLLCHQTALNLLFLKFVNIEYKFRGLRAVILMMKMPHPLFWEWLTGNEVAITLHPTWILTQGVPTQWWARPPTISYLLFQAAETVQDLS